MRLTFALFSCCASLAMLGLVSGTEYYSDMYDNLDIDAIINSNRLLTQYVNCILEKGSCTVDGRSLKHTLPVALATQCENCSDKQKYMARKVSNHLKKNKPNIWAEFLEKYDPDKEYITSFEEFLAQEEV